VGVSIGKWPENWGLEIPVRLTRHEGRGTQRKKKKSPLSAGSKVGHSRGETDWRRRKKKKTWEERMEPGTYWFSWGGSRLVKPGVGKGGAPQAPNKKKGQGE